MKDHTDGKKTIGSVMKAIEIMDLLASSKEEIGATEISNQLKLNVSGTYHILNTLKVCEVIEQNPKTKKYRLGMKLWKMGKMAREQNHLALLLQPFLKKLRDITGETANLTILDNNEIIYIAQEESTRLVRMFTKIGARVPLYCSAAGKVLLAFQSTEKQRSILNNIEFYPFTEKTIIRSKALEEQLQLIRDRGYAYDDEEREWGVSCIAAPIFDYDREVIAALSISGPTTRFTEENRSLWIQEILKLTMGVSQNLGYIK